ncbi:uncharacterized protein LOC108675109 [Hyalella azteca]|uniref:Uncharacterized protein LOC108675109 n=1 Tax=Hyalella azteca TaxID=294128 RepID=A0A8B7NXT5_HYAAZ|nr:uncharacterized protein LOC108675109 [Hyalella azteca]
MDLRLLAALGALLCVCCSIEEGSAYTFRTFMGAEIAATAISSSAVVQRPTLPFRQVIDFCKMDLRLLAALGALLCVCCSVEEGSAYTFRTFMGAGIAATAISTSALVQRPCECRALCRDGCVAVAIRRQPPRHFHCSFTDKTFANVTTGLTVPAPDSSVFYKRKCLVCLPGFMLVNNVGCIYVSTVALNFTAAAASCPFDSQLFTANFLIDFDAMREYLLKNFTTSGTFFWIGLIHAPDSTWQWLGGGTIPATHPSPYWGQIDPNEPATVTSCVGMYLNTFPQLSYLYHLADAPCATASKFLCKQI